MTRLDQYVAQLNKTVPGLKIEYKDKSLLMKIISVILFFNPKFMTYFVTTIGKTIYVPGAWRTANFSLYSALGIISHEYMHVRDYQRYSLFFGLIYLFPVSLLPFVITLFFILPWPFVVGLVLLCLAPLPAPGRMYFELRGYIMSMFVFNHLAKKDGMTKTIRLNNLLRMAELYNSQFTGSNYYFMWPFGVKDKLQNNIDAIISGDITKKDVVYREVSSAIDKVSL